MKDTISQSELIAVVLCTQFLAKGKEIYEFYPSNTLKKKQSPFY